MADSANWVHSGVFLRNEEKYSGTLAYSPSGEFAMTTVNKSILCLGEPRDHLLIIGILNSSLNRKLRIKEWTEIFYCYWLSDDVFVVFNEGEIHYTQLVYYCNFHNPKSQPILINERIIAFLNADRHDAELFPERAYIRDLFVNPCKITIEEQDFLFVKASEFLLCPYDIISAPQLPPMRLTMGALTEKVVDRGLWSDSEYAFAYKDSVYFCVRGGKRRMHMDRFIRVPLTDFDLKEKRIIVDQEARTRNLFEPELLNDGWFRNDLSEGLKIWQEGHMVLFYNTYPNNEHRTIWILNLEKGTIMEKIMNNSKFSYATLYKGFLQLWSALPNQNDEKREIVYKFMFLNNHVGKLSDLCTIKLLSFKR